MRISTDGGRFKHDLALLFAVGVWGINVPILKSALEVAPVYVVNVFRFGISLTTLGTLYFTLGRGTLAEVKQTLHESGWQIAGFGLIGYFFYQLTFILGVDLTTSGNVALISAGSPVWTALLTRLFGIERLSRRAWAGLSIALAGTMGVVFFGHHAFDLTSRSFLGNVLVFFSAILWGAYTALSRPAVARTSPVLLGFLGMSVAYPFLIAVSIPAWGTQDLMALPAWFWAAVVFSGGLSTGVTQVVWMSGVRALGASHTAAYGNLTPFITILAGYFMLGEPVVAAQLLGGVVILLGLFVMRGENLAVKVRSTAIRIPAEGTNGG